MKCPICQERAIGFREWGQGINAFTTHCDHCGLELRGSRWSGTTIAIIVVIFFVSLPVAIWLDTLGYAGIVVIFGAVLLAVPLAIFNYFFGEYEPVVDVPAEPFSRDGLSVGSRRGMLDSAHVRQIVERLQACSSLKDELIHIPAEHIIAIRERFVFNRFAYGALALIGGPLPGLGIILWKEGTLDGIGWPLAALVFVLAASIALMISIETRDHYYIAYLDGGRRIWLRPRVDGH